MEKSNKRALDTTLGKSAKLKPSKGKQLQLSNQTISNAKEGSEVRGSWFDFDKKN